jgi:hypothetical protein
LGGISATPVGIKRFEEEVGVSSRSSMIAIGALMVLGAGVIWILSDRTRNDQRANAAPFSDRTVVGSAVEGQEHEVSEPPMPIPGVSVRAQTEAIADATGGVSVDVGPRGADGWPMAALEFADEADPDPTLSRHLEVEIHRIVDITLDRARYETHSAICRGLGCQVLTRDRTPGSIPAAGPPLYDFIAPVLRGLSSAGIRSPTTGEDLKPKLEFVRSTRGAPSGIELFLVFESK